MIKKIKNNILNKKVCISEFGLRKCGGKEIIMEFALGAIAVVLAVVFREQLETVIKTVGGSFAEKISTLFTSL